jgi:hypothetical protein
MTDPTYLVPLNKDAALLKQAEIDELLGQISAHELRLAKSYARLGSRLKEMKVNQYWMSLGYQKFSSYLEFIRGKIGRERSQVYAILSVAEALLPAMTEEQLESVGITRAHELRRLLKEGGTLQARILDPNGKEEHPTDVRIMDYAARPGVTAKQLRVKVNELLHITEDVQGFWLDLGGFYATTDERKEIDQFWEVGKKMFAPPDEQAEHVVKHEVFLAGVRECLGTWLAEAVNAK